MSGILLNLLIFLGFISHVYGSYAYWRLNTVKTKSFREQTPKICERSPRECQGLRPHIHYLITGPNKPHSKLLQRVGRNLTYRGPLISTDKITYMEYDKEARVRRCPGFSGSSRFMDYVLTEDSTNVDCEASLFMNMWTCGQANIERHGGTDKTYDRRVMVIKALVAVVYGKVGVLESRSPWIYFTRNFFYGDELQQYLFNQMTVTHMVLIVPLADSYEWFQFLDKVRPMFSMLLYAEHFLQASYDLDYILQFVGGTRELARFRFEGDYAKFASSFYLMYATARHYIPEESVDLQYISAKLPISKFSIYFTFPDRAPPNFFTHLQYAIQGWRGTEYFFDMMAENMTVASTGTEFRQVNYFVVRRNGLCDEHCLKFHSNSKLQYNLRPYIDVTKQDLDDLSTIRRYTKTYADGMQYLFYVGEYEHQRHLNQYRSIIPGLPYKDSLYPNTPFAFMPQTSGYSVARIIMNYVNKAPYQAIVDIGDGLSTYAMFAEEVLETGELNIILASQQTLKLQSLFAYIHATTFAVFPLTLMDIQRVYYSHLTAVYSSFRSIDQYLALEKIDLSSTKLVFNMVHPNNIGNPFFFGLYRHIIRNFKQTFSILTDKVNIPIEAFNSIKYADFEDVVKNPGCHIDKENMEIDAIPDYSASQLKGEESKVADAAYASLLYCTRYFLNKYENVKPAVKIVNLIFLEYLPELDVSKNEYVNLNLEDYEKDVQKPINIFVTLEHTYNALVEVGLSKLDKAGFVYNVYNYHVEIINSILDRINKES